MDKRAVCWRSVTLGAGQRPVCVPVMGRDEAALGAFRCGLRRGGD